MEVWFKEGRRRLGIKRVGEGWWRLGLKRVGSEGDSELFLWG